MRREYCTDHKGRAAHILTLHQRLTFAKKCNHFFTETHLRRKTAEEEDEQIVTTRHSVLSTYRLSLVESDLDTGLLLVTYHD